jgi:hypothetical protein
VLNISLISIDLAKNLVRDKVLGLYQEPFWWEIVEKGFDKNCRVALITDMDKNKLLLPLFFHKIGPILRIGSPLRGTFTPYMGFIHLCDNVSLLDEENYWDYLITYLHKMGAHWIEISTTSEREVIGSCSKFVHETPKTIVLSTNKNEEFLWQNMQGRSRNLVRKAEKFGLKANTLKSSDTDIELFYSMLESTFKKSGKHPPHSLRFYKLMASHTMNTGNLLFLSIQKGAKTISMGMFLYNLSGMHFISGTSTREGNKHGANNLMHWEVIKFACKHEIEYYDFGGLGIPSIDKFKRSFGGNDVEYRRYIWMNPFVNFLFNIAMKVKSILPFIRQGLRGFKGKP